MIKKSFYFTLFLVLGLLIFFYHTAITGFNLMPGDAGDAMLINYILEHFWLWLHQIPQHQSFWDMPFNYPIKNTLAYSDVMIGGGLFYVPIRFFVKNPFNALQIWMGIMCLLNYTLFYILLRRLKYSFIPSLTGAFIFAFCSLRYYKMNHLQFYVQYPIILSLLYLSYLKDNKHIAIGGFFAFLSLQFWSVYTLGFTFCLTAFVGTLMAICFKNTRCLIVEFIKKYYILLAIYGFIFVISLIPLARHYLLTETYRGWQEVLYHFVDLTIWIRNISILDNIILKHLPIITQHNEICGGIGIFTMFIAFCGLWKLKKYNKPILLTIIFLMLLCVKYGSFSPWYFIYKYIPGAEGIRVVSRICFIFLILYCIGIANFIQHLQIISKNLRVKLVLTLTLIIFITEQLPITEHTYLWSKRFTEYYINEVSKNIPKSCKVLYAENKNQIVAVDLITMWAASVNNIYSANGSTGVLQKNYENTPEYCTCEFDFESNQQ